MIGTEKYKATDLVYDDFEKYEVWTQNRKEFAKKYDLMGDSYAHLFKFENNYGASVIKHFGSYGYIRDLFELAVIKWTSKDEWELCYTTPITDDVIGYLTNEEVLELLERIKGL